MTNSSESNLRPSRLQSDAIPLRHGGRKELFQDFQLNKKPFQYNIVCIINVFINGN